MSITTTREVKVSDVAAEVNYSEIDIEMQDGTRHQKVIHYAFGDPKNPMSFDDMCQKFNNLAGSICLEKQREALIRFSETIEEVTNVTEVLAKCW